MQELSDQLSKVVVIIVQQLLCVIKNDKEFLLKGLEVARDNAEDLIEVVFFNILSLIGFELELLLHQVSD